MSDARKSTLQLLLLFSLTALPFVWLLRSPRRNPALGWGLICAFGLVALLASIALVRAATAKDQIPHLLERLSLKHYAKDGLIFAVQPRVVGDLLQVAVIYQNCFERLCEASVHLDPPQRHRSFSLKPNPEMMLTVPIQCDGAALGMTVIHVAVPKKFQGRHQEFDLSVKQRYPQGRGPRLLRARGMPLTRKDVKALSPVGVMIEANVDAVAVQLPDTLRETADGLPAPAMTTLWNPVDGEPDLHRIGGQIQVALAHDG